MVEGSVELLLYLVRGGCRVEEVVLVSLLLSLVLLVEDRDIKT